MKIIKYDNIYDFYRYIVWTMEKGKNILVPLK